MIKWISYTLGNFFSHKLSKEGNNKNFFNVFFQLITYLLILTAILSLGYNLSFKTHYKNANGFKDFMYSLSLEHDINLKVNEDKVSAYLGTDESNGIVINSFENEADLKYAKNDYNVIIDTRDSSNTYVTFDVVYYNISDENDTITADEFRDPEKGSNYTGRITVNNELVSYSVDDINSYKAWLDSYIPTLDDSHAYVSEFLKLESLDKQTKQYSDAVYALYTKAYYCLTIAPTVQTYYQYTYAVLDENNEYKYNDYLIVTDSWILLSFTSDNGVNITYDGYYNTLDDNFVIFTLQTNSESIIKSNIDLLVTNTFSSVSSVKALYTGTTLFRFYPVLFIALSLLALLIHFASKSKNKDYADSFAKGLKIVSGYLFMSAVFAGLIGFILAFFVRQDSSFAIATWSSVAILGIRTIIFIIYEETKFKQVNNDDDNIDDEPIIINDKTKKIVKLSDEDEFKMKKM